MASAQAQKPEAIAPCECLLYLLKNERGKVGLRARCDTHRLFAMVTEDRSIAVQREPFQLRTERSELPEPRLRFSRVRRLPHDLAS